MGGLPLKKNTQGLILDKQNGRYAVLCNLAEAADIESGWTILSHDELAWFFGEAIEADLITNGIGGFLAELVKIIYGGVDAGRCRNMSQL